MMGWCTEGLCICTSMLCTSETAALSWTQVNVFTQTAQGIAEKCPLKNAKYLLAIA